MKLLRFTLIGLLCLPFAALLAIVCLNIGDEELDPQAKAALEHRETIPPAIVQGYKYLLAIRVPDEQDPKTKGEELYLRAQDRLSKRDKIFAPVISSEERSFSLKGGPNACSKGGYCKRELISGNEKQIRDYLAENETGLKRFDELVANEGAATDLRPSMYVAGPTALIMNLIRLKQTQMSLAIYDGKSADVPRELEMQNRFYTNSLRYPHFMIEDMIMINALEANRRFIEEAVKENPQLKTKLTPASLETYRLPFSYDEIASRAANFEFQTVADVLNGEINADTYDIAAFSDEDRSLQERVIKHVFNSTAPLLFKRNQSINRFFEFIRSNVHHPCIGNESVSCDPPPRTLTQSLGYFVNPIGKFTLMIMEQHTAHIFRKMKIQVDRLNQPFEVN